MKTSISLSRDVMVGAVMMASILPVVAVGPFFENFESGLGQWTGRGGGAYSGEITLDPLSSGRGNVLYFTNLNTGGDLFASSPISLAGQIQISFDYLGLPSAGGTPGDLGGFVGIVYSLTATTLGTDLFWYAGTQDSYPGLTVFLTDDGVWHNYSFQLNASAMPAFHLMLEDYIGSGGVPGDVFFDNISVAPVPEPAVGTLAMVGLLSAAFAGRVNRRV